jgi:SAM-dependent methyltransferase
MNKCLVCGHTDFKPVYSSTLLKCMSCGFVTANMQVSPELLEKTYSENYFKGEEYLDYLQDKEILQLNFKKRIETVRKLSRHSLPVTNCLEIGCAYGFFGELIVKNFTPAYLGFDVVREAVAFAHEKLGLQAKTTSYLDEPAPESPYSDVFMWDVVEHLERPDMFIEKAGRDLLPGGRIYITTGDISAWLPRMQGRSWRMIHPPSHLHYFSRGTLTRLLENKGFSVLKTSYPPVYRSIRQVFYSLFVLHKSNHLETLVNKIPLSWNVPINTFDIVFIVAEKNEK